MNKKENRPSKIAYERHLNQMGVPEKLKRSNGGYIPDYVKYGTWIRINEPENFESGYASWKEKMRSRES